MMRLEARALTVELGARRVLDGLDLSLEPGRFTVIVGPNGAGKTTLLRSLAGLASPTRGGVVLNDLPLAGMPAAERRRAVLDELARLFGPRAAQPEAFYERDWTAEQWSRGCYGAFLGPGAWTAFGDALKPPVGPLHWAGAEIAHRWSGYMDGAVRSGEAAAAAVLDSSTLATAS